MSSNEYSRSLLVSGLETINGTDDDDDDLETNMTGLSISWMALHRNGDVMLFAVQLPHVACHMVCCTDTGQSPSQPHICITWA
jgi:hypothetical protein